MSDKEIAKEILLKLIEEKVLIFTPTEQNNEKNLQSICEAYKTVFQTVAVPR